MSTSAVFSRIAGSGSCLPPKVVTNAQLAAELGSRGIETSDDWIVERTGIRQRYLAERGVKTSSLAIEAARNAITDAGVDASEIDLIILATSTASRASSTGTIGGLACSSETALVRSCCVRIPSRGS